MPSSSCETWSWTCDDLGSNILVFCWSHNYAGKITASDCMDIFGNQGHPLIQMLSPNNNAIFRDDSSFIHTAGSVLSWFEEHEDALPNLTWPSSMTGLNHLRTTVFSFRE